ncbi:MAG: hypothetical protein B6D56_00145 [Candidatus Omnitrophica bacterium 4484_70.1]|nr:MAG: hypothetical protein B6D56_00145 [Candidatus Omnitrophica bacterium 4484_70.1]
MDKNKRKFLRKKISLFFLKIFISLCESIPLSTFQRLGKFLGKIAYYFISPQRKIALESLKIAFPNLSLKERKKITKKFFIFMVQASLEVIYFSKFPSLLEKEIEVEGEEFLKEALSKGKGVVLLTAHYGNFPLISLFLAQKGYKINVVARPMRDERVGELVENLRAKAGVKTIFSYPRKECVNGIIKALRNNEIVMIQMDQNFGTGGVWVKFFGKLAATPTGPIVISLRTKSAIVPVYIRKNESKHLVRFFPEEPLEYFSDRDEMILRNAIKFTKIIESWIKEVPYFWSWNHRRWKSRPSQKIFKIRFKVQKD